MNATVQTILEYAQKLVSEKVVGDSDMISMRVELNFMYITKAGVKTLRPYRRRHSKNEYLQSRKRIQISRRNLQVERRYKRNMSMLSQMGNAYCEGGRNYSCGDGRYGADSRSDLQDVGRRYNYYNQDVERKKFLSCQR